MADQHDHSETARRQYSRGPTIPKPGRSYFRITCPFCGSCSYAYVWSIRGGGKKCENKECRAKFDAWGFAYPRIKGKRELARIAREREADNLARGRPADFGEQGIGIGGMKGDD